MTKQEYSDLLLSPEWKKKRKEILKRDGYRCQKCGNKDTLHVHHTYYISGHLPWEYRNSCFTTLCKSCHYKEHEDRPIGDFVKASHKQEKKKTPARIEHRKYLKKKTKPRKTKSFKLKPKTIRKREALKIANEKLRARQNPNIKYNFSEEKINLVLS